MTDQQRNASERGAFHTFEQAGWSRAGVVSAYQTSFGRLTTQIVPALLDAVGAGPGSRLLDVATGPGFAAAAAAERGASAIGVDFSPAMVREARHNYAAIDFREGDALALDFPDNSFDAVVTNFGILHYEQPDRAIAEVFRVLRPGGRGAFTAWCEPHRAVAFGIVLDAVRAHGDPDVPVPPGPYFFRFSSREEWLTALGQAGFRDCQTAEVELQWTFAESGELIEAFEAGTVRTGGLLERQTAEQLARIKRAIAEAAVAYAQPGGGLKVPMPAVLAWGVKPEAPSP